MVFNGGHDHASGLVMSSYILLLRGINVGGKNLLPMKELAALLHELGLDKIKTYLQSGNVVFQSKGPLSHEASHELAHEIEASVGLHYGFTPQVFVLSLEELENAVAINPFPEAEDEPKSLHLLFMASVPDPVNVEKLEALRIESEKFTVIERILYLHAPEGIGRSKLAARAEKTLAVAGTSRNWRSANAILAMAKDSHS